MMHGLSAGQGKQVYQWSKAIEVGHAEIDAEHRRWFDYLNELRDAAEGADGDAVIRKTVDELKAYIVMHFAHEEQIMDGFAYDERDRHKRAHRAFTRKCDEIEREKSSSREICQAISIFIYDWLVSHISSVDRVMGIVPRRVEIRSAGVAV